MQKKKTNTGLDHDGSSAKENRKTKGVQKNSTASEFKDLIPIVGIGASAGGLEAFEQFFTHAPQDTGMAFVLVQHLDPRHKSILSELVQRYTGMSVHEVEDGMTVEPDNVYVIPPNRRMALLHGKLHLLEQGESLGVKNPIDFFFRSLAADQKERAICIVLSGTGSEGALGLRAVKAEDGLVMAQTPESAKYDGMPRNAIATGLVDYVLPAENMADQIVRYLKKGIGETSTTTGGDDSKNGGLLQKIYILIRFKTGHDFSFYKQNTILRRIERRMVLNQISHLAEYVRYMQEDPWEAVILFKELLIGVTNFFRDKEAFDALNNKVIPALCDARTSDDPLRIWVPGCSSGEEAYSLAMLTHDYIVTNGKNVSLQIFATDIDGDAVEVARQGLYSDIIAADLLPGYAERFFTREDGSLRVKKEIRDKVVFALQNVIADPPFSKIDLISCRNLLIYLGPELQKKVLPLFHYSLKKDGFLFLGTSETIGEYSDYFSVIDRKLKLFKRKDTSLARSPIIDLYAPTLTDRRVDAQKIGRGGAIKGTSFREVAEQIILDIYGPTAVVINEKSEILYIHGRAGKYLEPPSGDFTGNILAMAREGLKLELSSSLRKVIADNKEIRTENVRVKTNGKDHLINLIVKPIFQPASLAGSLMVIFEEARSQDGSNPIQESPSRGADKSDPRIKQLEQELRSTKEYLQTTIEELETTNEELKSTNEELQSSNEELQSTNEELETSREELQSINEELTTVNTELQQKIIELSKTGSDLNNLLASTDIGTIFLDTELNIRRFTPAATSLLSLLQSDLGRPVTHLATNMNYDRLEQDSQEVLRTLEAKEIEVFTKHEHWFIMRIMPYRTIENVIDGIVITFVDITQRKQTEQKLLQEIAQREKAQREAQSALNYSESVINTVRGPLVVIDQDLKIVSANRAFYEFFHVNPEESKGNLLYNVGDHRLDIPKLRKLLHEVLPKKTEVVDYKVDHVFDGSGPKVITLNARQIASQEGEEAKALIVLAMET